MGIWVDNPSFHEFILHLLSMKIPRAEIIGMHKRDAVPSLIKPCEARYSCKSK